MGTNGGTIISFTPNPSLHAVTSRMPSHHPTGCANFTFQIPSIANAKKNTNSAERRANHNAVERARRECLNTKFQELAHALPSLAQVRRPSKSIIVQKSLDFIYTSRQKDEEMRRIRSENESLYDEVNRLREQLGMEPLPPREESEPTTSEQSDEAKEDANSSKNLNAPDIKIEADNNPTTTTHEFTSSTDINPKSEDSRSDDDCSNGNTDDDYDPDLIDSNNNPTEENQDPRQTCLYDNEGLMYNSPMLDPSLTYPTTDFNYIPIDNYFCVTNGINALFPLQYPSPPYDMNIGHMQNFPMNTDDLM